MKRRNRTLFRCVFTTFVLVILLIWLSGFLVLFINLIDEPELESESESESKFKYDVLNPSAHTLSNEIRDGMQFAFQAYMRDAWRADEYMPVKQRGLETFGGKGLTIIDSMDTLFMMGLTTEYKSARYFVEHEFVFEGDIAVFENTIRVLGGLLSMYSLTNDSLFLAKAKMVGEVLLQAFPQRIPCGKINSHKPNACKFMPWAHNKAVNAEVGTLSLEFVALSEFTGDSRWSDKITAINEYWQDHSDGLLGMWIDPKTEVMSGAKTIGGGIDSTYEYFIKLKLLSGDKLSGELYDRFEKMIIDDMFVTVGGTSLLKEIGSGKANNKVEHLGCFIGGMLIMGQTYIKEGLAFTETCARMYTTNPSGISCEEVNIQKDGSIRCASDRYLLRPEVVESIFYAWRETHDPKWREYATQIWRAIARWTQVESGGFTDVHSVTTGSPKKDDMQESWFLAETMKYLWMIFQPDAALELDKYVLNTECHPIRSFNKNY